ncbi:DUF2239 family protein [Deinococcus apachensis]|uniref:DUF2239 family protein n=1 Tax=Deinococcus apachensis TaxID=309886 RepID=UPI00036BECC0|nr:DUF2239 family protein [Deinococcus apachensis]
MLIFKDQTGRQVDFDPRGSLDDVLARHVPEAPRKGPGRPKLGVVARGVTLMPRHWSWLDEQRGGTSATLRRLIDEARRHDGSKQEAARAAEAAGRVITALAGNMPNFEGASRALCAGQGGRFAGLTRTWPEDVRAYALRLAQPAFARA